MEKPVRTIAESRKVSTDFSEYTLKNYLQFIIPSLLGIILFVIPISFKGEYSIPVAILANLIKGFLGETLPYLATFIMVVTALISLYVKVVKPLFILDSVFLSKLFNVSWVWQTARLIGMAFSVMALLKIGPDAVSSENTGGLLLYDLIPVLFSVFLFAGLFLPLLLDFGLLELCGALFTRVMRPLFKLPGRSSIDCLASWLGDGTIGVLLTNKQYEDGHYTQREAAIIGTTFSVVSITFTIVIISYLQLDSYLVPFYLTIVLAGLACALISPRIPPLSKKPDTHYGEKRERSEIRPKNVSAVKWGILQAVKQASGKTNYRTVVKGGIQNVLDMWLGVLPIVMAIGTVALMIAEYTPVFKFLGAPFIPFLEIMQIPEAVTASQTIVVGFADMFLPAIIGSGIESEMTRFVIGCLSITQLIYMSEVGGLLLGSKLPVTFMDLIVIFLLRTLISLPIIAIVAHLVF